MMEVSKKRLRDALLILRQSDECGDLNLQADDSGIMFTTAKPGRDGDVMTYSIGRPEDDDGQVEPFEACVDSMKLKRPLSGSMKGTVTIEYEDEHVVVTDGKKSWRVFDSGYEETKQVEHTGQMLVELAFEDHEVPVLEACLAHSSTDETRPKLCGLGIVAEPTGVALVATDTYRIIHRRVSTGGLLGLDAGLLNVDTDLLDAPRTLGIIPKQLVPWAIYTANKQSDGFDYMVISVWDDGTVKLWGAGWEINSYGRKGEFPLFQNVVGGLRPWTIEVQREPLLDALESLEPIAAEDANRLTITLDEEEGRLVLEAIADPLNSGYTVNATAKVWANTFQGFDKSTAEEELVEAQQLWDDNAESSLKDDPTISRPTETTTEVHCAIDLEYLRDAAESLSTELMKIALPTALSTGWNYGKQQPLTIGGEDSDLPATDTDDAWVCDDYIVVMPMLSHNAMEWL